MRVRALWPAVLAGAVLLFLASAATKPIEAATEQAASATDEKAAAVALERLRAMIGMDAPGKTPSATYHGDDSCRWANDGECDDPRIGTGACRAGTDYSDCWRIAQGVEDDSCRWANDGECDEPGFGTGVCTQATDHADCGDIGYLRFQTDSCDTAFDGVCNEPGVGDGTCAARTDRSDCIGRERPMQIYDNYFGYDDRVLLDTTVSPWSMIGLITRSSDGVSCTATLVADDVIVTAAHCITADNGLIDAGGLFETGFGMFAGARSARVTGYLIDGPKAGDDSETDWALLRIDQPLGRNLGYLGVRPLADYSQRRVQMLIIDQAGYSWDTGDHLSGNIGCSIIQLTGNNMLQHDCDTTHGDSGSPLMVEDNGEYYIVATDAAFDLDDQGQIINIATRVDAWAPLLADFAAGRSGTPVGTATKAAAN